MSDPRHARSYSTESPSVNRRDYRQQQQQQHRHSHPHHQHQHQHQQRVRGNSSGAAAGATASAPLGGGDGGGGGGPGSRPTPRLSQARTSPTNADSEPRRGGDGGGGAGGAGGPTVRDGQLAVWQRVVDGLERLDVVKRKEDEAISAINRIHDELMKDTRGRSVPPSKAESLSELYKEALEKCVEEERTITAMVKDLTALIERRKAGTGSPVDSGRQSPEVQKKRRREEEEKIAPIVIKKPRSMSKADAAKSFKPDQAVAALCNTQNGEEWILARVLSYDSENQKYTVQDDEPDEEGKRLTYELIPRNVLALPPPAGSASAWPEFPPASAVLGLYPGTSCLYKGEVVSPPSKYRQKPPTYVITFENDNGQQIPVDAGMVIEYPQGFD